MCPLFSRHYHLNYQVSIVYLTNLPSQSYTGRSQTEAWQLPFQQPSKDICTQRMNMHVQKAGWIIEVLWCQSHQAQQLSEYMSSGPATSYLCKDTARLSYPSVFPTEWSSGLDARENLVEAYYISFRSSSLFNLGFWDGIMECPSSSFSASSGRIGLAGLGKPHHAITEWHSRRNSKQRITTDTLSIERERESRVEKR